MSPAFSRGVLAACLAMVLGACSPPAPTFKGSDVTGIGWGGDISMQAHTGGRVSTADFQGEVLIVFFGYTRCGDVCSPTLARLAALRRAFGDEGREVQVVFVTVDPAYDTPARLAAFLSGFDPSFVGLTGTQEEIETAAEEYKIEPASVDEGNAHPWIDQDVSVFVKDTTGELRVVWKNETSVADMAHDVRLLLQQTG